MAKRQTKAEKALDAEINRLYTQNCAGIQVSILDIPSIFDEARKAKFEGRDMKQAIIDYVNKIRKN